MFRAIFISILGILLFAGISSKSFSQEVKVEKIGGNDSFARVTGFAPKKVWLGVTVVVDGKEQDYQVVEVKGKFTKDYNLKSLLDMANAANSSIKWIVCLWEKKVNNCGCQYCKRNGYHMEGRIAQDSYQ